MTIIHLTPWATAAVLAAAAVGSAAQAVTGFGYSLVSVPVLLLVIGPAHAVRLANISATVVNVFLLTSERRRTDVGAAIRLLLPALLVTPIAAYVVHRTDPTVLSVVVGTAIIACAALLATGRRSDRLQGRRGMVAAGAISSAMNTASGVGGPAVAMYAVNAGWEPAMSRPTLQLYFLGLNILSFVSLGPVGLHATPAALEVGCIVGGLFAGRVAARRLETSTVARAVILLAIVGGTIAIVRAVLG